MIINEQICARCLRKAAENSGKITTEGLSKKQRMRYIKRTFRWLKTGLLFTNVKQRNAIVSRINSGILEQLTKRTES